MDPDTIWNAIFGQESNSGTNNRTSVTGAIGPGQIQPETFSLYARPGENINNYNDNIAVSKRIVNDYFGRYGPDPGRIATAYFSGPNNVSPPNSPQPFIQNRPDPTGKTTASYVSDISRRLKTMPDPNFDASKAFSQWESPAAPPAQQQFNPQTAFSQWEQPAQAVQQQESNVPIPPDRMTPAQLAEDKLAEARGNQSSNWFTENYHPLSAITQTFNSGQQELGQGFQDIKSGNVATGTGNMAMGVMNTALAPLLGPYNETLRMAGQAIGNPQAADVASLVLPTRGVGTALKAALPATRAAEGIVSLVGKENIPTVIQRLQNNPNLSLMDVSEPVKTVAAGLANSPETPTAQNIMKSAYDARTNSRQDIVQKAMDDTLGPNINVKDYIDQLKENVKNVGQQRINPALQGAQPIGVMPLVQRLDNVITAPGTADETVARLSKLKDQITSEAGSDGFIDPQKLHGIQWRLRAEASNLATSASGADRNLASPLMDARNDMVNAIDNASGGQYKPALAGFRDENNVQDAFEKGLNVFKTGGVEDFPEYWDAWAKQAQPAELAAAKVGALTAARRTIEGMQGGARRGENILGPTFNQNKLATLFGDAQTNQLSGLLADARSMTDTNSLLYRNSKTAQVTAGQNYFQPRQVGSPSGTFTGIGAGLGGAMALTGGAVEPGAIGLGYAGLKGIHTGLQYLGKLADKSTATNFAKLASASDGPSRNQLINILRSASAANQGNKLSNLSSSLFRLAAP